jgi:hypothetical protein
MGYRVDYGVTAPELGITALVDTAIAHTPTAAILQMSDWMIQLRPQANAETAEEITKWPHRETTYQRVVNLEMGQTYPYELKTTCGLSCVIEATPILVLPLVGVEQILSSAYPFRTGDTQ